MKKIGRIWFPVILLMILGLAYFSFFGLRSSDGMVLIRGVKDIHWGIDVSGGVSVTFGPAGDVDNEDAGNATNRIAETMGVRFEDCGISNYEIYSDTENMRVIVSFPWKDDGTKNVDRVIERLSVTAHITLVEGRLEDGVTIVSYIDERGRSVAIDSNGERHRLTLDGSVISGARTIRDDNGQLAVQLAFTEKGRQLFLESAGRLTALSVQNTERCITVCLDNRPISRMYVQGVTDECVIARSGGLSTEEADTLISFVNSGRLDYPVQIMDYALVDATLGQDSVKVMLIAGLIAFGVICLFMILRYRMPGAVGCIALLGQIAGSLAAVSGFIPVFESFTLTLPGVAGIILSIGMGVDANIITGERVSEEVRKGKSIDGAIDAGIENSISSIFDGNVTVMVVAIILMGVFGPPDTIWSILLKPFTWMFPTSTTGFIYAFGYTLFVGVIFNFIMGVTASRIMLKSLSGYPALRNRRLYGGGE